MKIIGINGTLGSGKTTAAILLAAILDTKGYDVYYKTYAFKLKQIVEILTGMKLMHDDSGYVFQNGLRDFSEAQKNTYIEDYGMTVGQMLQFLGTDLFRNHWDKDVWLKAVFMDYNPKDMNGKIWIIGDVRFPNEAEWIKKLAPGENKIIRITGDPNGTNERSTRDKKHASEISMDNYEFDYEIVNDGTLEDLRNKLQAFANDNIKISLPKEYKIDLKVTDPDTHKSVVLNTNSKQVTFIKETQGVDSLQLLMNTAISTLNEK